MCSRSQITSKIMKLRHMCRRSQSGDNKGGECSLGKSGEKAGGIRVAPNRDPGKGLDREEHHTAPRKLREETG